MALLMVILIYVFCVPTPCTRVGDKEAYGCCPLAHKPFRTEAWPKPGQQRPASQLGAVKA